jgi:hypothetical protein
MCRAAGNAQTHGHVLQVDWGELNMEIYHSVFSQRAPAMCTLCESSAHTTADHPRSVVGDARRGNGGAAPVAADGAAASNLSGGGNPAATERCKRFNTKRSCSLQSCKFAHTCGRCGKPAHSGARPCPPRSPRRRPRWKATLLGRPSGGGRARRRARSPLARHELTLLALAPRLSTV